MKLLWEWIVGATRTTVFVLFQIFLFCFAMLGLYTASNFALEVSKEKCAAITEHVSLCLIDVDVAKADVHAEGTTL